MGPSDKHALNRILEKPGRADAFDLLSQELSGTELTTFLLGTFERRVSHRELSDVRRQFEQDRFTAIAPIPAVKQARVELATLEAAADAGFETIGLAPLAPLGVHHALGATPQNNVVATSRGTEVAADPTNVLALEAARRRTDLVRTASTRGSKVDLAATQRVTRAQHFSGPRSFAHFSIFGMTSAGRDQGDFRFEVHALRRQLAVLIAAVRSVNDARIGVRLSPFNDSLADRCEALARDLAHDQVAATIWPDREHGRGYYRNICFKIDLHLDNEVVEVGDGGDVDWMQSLMQSRKERLVIGGLGLERLAMVQ